MSRSSRLLILLFAVSLFSVFGSGGAMATTASGQQETGYQAGGAVISRIEALEGNDGVAVLISGSRDFTYSTYRFENPPRLAIDVPDSEVRGLPGSITVGKGPIKTITNREFRNEKQRLTRIEISLEDDGVYETQVSMIGKTLTVFFPGEFSTPAASQVVLDRHETAVPDSTVNVPPRRITGPEVPYVKTAQASASSPASRLVEQTIGREEDVHGDADVTYEGLPISLDLKDADVTDIFMTLSDLTGYNIIIDPSVKGKISIRMNEVPWEQAFDIILKQLELGKDFTGMKSEEYPRGNIIRIAPVRKLQKEAEERRALLDARKTAEPLTSKIFYLSYAEAKQMQQRIKPILTKRGDIIVDERTNSLIITDIMSSLDKAKNMIILLDIRTKQVLISGQIVTTKKNFLRELGIQWGGRFIADAVHGNTTGYRFPNYYTVDGTSNGGYAVNLPQGSPIVGLTLGNVLNTLQLNFLLSASESEGITKTISTPRIVTSDNIAAEIKTGTQIPYTVFSDRGLEVQFKDAVISLKVTPHITNDNHVAMKIAAKKDSPVVYNDIVSIDINQATTEVLVKDGDTVVIGGLNQSREQESFSRIPFLHQIPILGWFFKSRIVDNEYIDLLIFISPKIIVQDRSQVQTITFDQGTPSPSMVVK